MQAKAPNVRNVAGRDSVRFVTLSPSLVLRVGFQRAFCHCPCPGAAHLDDAQGGDEV